ncbi:MAG: AAA family ATPase [Chloroflexi bacterium]|nr:AAA family ATPase [Chloroflexota bacterium]
MALDDSADVPFLVAGRQSQFDQLLGYLHRAMAGQAQIVFVTGEAGIGKTKLVCEVYRQAQALHKDVIVAWGDCGDSAGGNSHVPYQPFKQIFTQLQSSSLDSKRILTIWGPHLVDRFIDSGEPEVKPKYQGELETEQILVQYSHVIKELSKVHPLVLVIDDLHRSDANTLDLFLHLSQQVIETREMPLLLIGAYRTTASSTEQEANLSRLEKAKREIRRKRQSSFVIDMASTLEPTAARAFVDALLDQVPNRLDDKFRRLLVRRTEGNALFASALFDLLKQRELLKQDSTGHLCVVRKITIDELPETVNYAIDDLIDHMEEEERELLRCGSVEGEQFTAEVVARVKALEERKVIDQICDRLEQQLHLVQDAGSDVVNRSQQLCHFRFRHALYQFRFYHHKLQPAQRTKLHHAVGVALETLYGAETSKIAGQLARHFVLGGDENKAIIYYQQAGDQALNECAYKTAKQEYNRALKLIKKVFGTADDSLLTTTTPQTTVPTSDLSDLREKIASLFSSEDLENLCFDLGMNSEDYGKTRTSIARGLLNRLNADNRIAELVAKCKEIRPNVSWQNMFRVPISRTVGSIRFELLAGRAKAFGKLGNQRQQGEDLRGLSALARKSNDLTWSATVQISYAEYYEEKGDYKAAIAAAERARDAAQRTNNPTLECESLIRLLWAYFWADWRKDNSYEATVDEYAKIALRVSRTIKHRQYEAQVLSYLGLMLRERDKLTESTKYLKKALLIAHETKDCQCEIDSYSNLAFTSIDACEFQAGVDYAQKALEIAHTIGSRWSEAENIEPYVWSLRLAGRYTEALDHGTWGKELAREVEHPWAEGSIALCQGELFTALGKYDLAHESFKQATIIWAELGSRENQGWVFLGQSRLYRETGDPELAVQNAIKAQDIYANFELASRRHFLVSEELGSIYAELGRLDQSHNAFIEALQVASEIGVDSLIITQKANLARVALARRDVDGAHQNAHDVAVWISKHGLDHLVEPFVVTLACINVLKTIGEETQWRSLLENAYGLLTTRANGITDPALHQSYLLNVKANRDLVSAWETVHHAFG